MGRLQYDEQLTAAQRRAVFHKQGPLLVVAGPGSGKTRVITYRIAALIDSGVSPHNICAITFTNKAAEEMRQRANRLAGSAGVHISTFHSLCARILRRYAEQAGISANFSIYDSSDQSKCVRQAVKDCELDTTNFPPARMLQAISNLKNQLIDVEDFQARADDVFSRKFAQVYGRYQKILAEDSAVDFDDLLMRTAFLLRASAEVCSELGQRFRFLLVDEYQDTNHAQYEIAKRLVGEHGNICVTGDPDQSIYRWRGADIRNILAFEKDWPNATVVKLEENFRSTANILEAADKLIAANQSRKQKILIPTRPRGEDVVVTACEDERQEAQGIVMRIRELISRGVSPREIAIFYRVNAMSRVLEEAFIENRIAYQIVRGVEFYSRKEIRDLLAYVRVLVNPDDEVALLRIVNAPSRGIGKTTLDRLGSYAAMHKITLYKAMKNAEQLDSLSRATKTKIAAFVQMMNRFTKKAKGKVGALAEYVFAESGLQRSLEEGPGSDEFALENVKELINAAHTYDAQTPDGSPADYLQQISLFSDADAYDTSIERVAMMTLHTAKGLEFDNVFIAGLEEGILPHERSNGDDEEMEEERRLLFVGITRARSNLFLSYARYRTIRGQLSRTIPSQFLFELGIDFSEQAPNPWGAGGQAEDGRYVGDAPCAGEDADCGVESFAPDELVMHKTFGMGRVREFFDMGADSVVVVQFNRGQTKSLMVRYAALSRL